MRNAHRVPFPTGRLSDGKRRSILFDAAKCIGCRQCVQACKDWNEHPRTTIYEISSSNWITIEPPVLEGMSPVWGRKSCMHCELPMCAAVCPVEAITRYDEGAVVIDAERCIGCRYCVHACPWNVISIDPATGKPAKCTLCSSRVGAGERPFCVQACPVGALEFGLAQEMIEKARARANEAGGYLYGEKEAGGTHVVCVLGEKRSQYGMPELGTERYPAHRIPAALMIKDLFTLHLGIPARARALWLALVHPGRLKYRYWQSRKSDQAS